MVSLIELFDAPSDVSWTKSRDEIDIEFSIGNKIYRGQFERIDETNDDRWSFWFWLESIDNEWDHPTIMAAGSRAGNIGTGDEFKVYSTIINILYTFIQKYNPDVLMFAGKEDTKSHLYNRIIKKYANKLKSKGYNLFQSTDVTPGYVEYMLRKEDSTYDLSREKFRPM